MQETALDGEPDTRRPEALTEARSRRAEIQAQVARLDAEAREHLHPNEPDAVCVHAQGPYVMGYTAQAIADQTSGRIVQTEVLCENTDSPQRVPQTEAARETLGESPEVTVVDAGYTHGAQLQRSEEAGVNIVVPTPPDAPALHPGTHEKVAGAFDKNRFTDDPARDGYVCPQGQLIPLDRIARGKHGVGVETRVYRCTHEDCPVRTQCRTRPDGRAIDRQPWDATLERHRARYEDPDIAASRHARKAIIEPVFAQLKWNQGFRRFTVRGEDKVNAQWALLCTAYDLKKLDGLWKTGRFTLTHAVAAAA